MNLNVGTRGGSGPTTDTHNPRIRNSYGREEGRGEGGDGEDEAEIVGDEWRVPSQRGSRGRREETLPPSLRTIMPIVCVLRRRGGCKSFGEENGDTDRTPSLSIYPSWIEREIGKEEEN